ncbi:MAG: hypothetical protein MJZ37_06750 [Bacilli bacterium]|nr:hypothetical protein [Bacilli bacterium]
MESLESYQHLRLVTSEGMIANGDYILDDGVIRTKQGYLCDSLDEENNILPAVESNDGHHIEHWKDGELHCEKEPAVIDVLENKEEWWLHGSRVLPKES